MSNNITINDDLIPLDPESFGVKKKYPLPPTLKRPPLKKIGFSP